MANKTNASELYEGNFEVVAVSIRQFEFFIEVDPEILSLYQRGVLWRHSRHTVVEVAAVVRWTGESFERSTTVASVFPWFS